MIQVTATARTSKIKKSSSSKDERRPSDSIIHWSLQKGMFVPVTCGQCGRQRDVRAAYARQSNYTGLCLVGHGRKHVKDQTLSSGSIIYWSRRNKAIVPIQCGKCKQEWLRSTGSLSGKRLRDEYKGYCPTCASGEHTQDELHPSGTIIHWGERELGQPKKYSRVKITCHGCKQKSFVRPPHEQRRNWSGLCSKCIRERPSPRKIHGDEKLPTGSIIHWDERDPQKANQRAMVTCGLCGLKRLTAIPGGEHRRVIGTGFCSTHKRAEIIALIQSRALSATVSPQSTVEQDHTYKGKVGRPSDFPEAKALAIINEHGCQISKRRLATLTGSNRASVDRWISRCGFNSLEELLEAEKQKGGVRN